jgi:glycosyltransferase involved in cell wall biosynthesis
LSTNREIQLRVSVITPTYNHATFIRDTIESVIGQTYPLIEYIIVDNLSDDGTDAIVEEYQSEYELIYIREGDRGQADAINKGLDAAQGELVCWLNSDDFYCNSDVVADAVSFFLADPDLKLLIGNGYYCDIDKNMLGAFPFQSRRLTKAQLDYMNPILQPSTFWRRNDLRMNAMLHYSFDWMFFREMFQRNCKYQYTSRDFSVYRMYGTNKSGSDNATRRLELYQNLRHNLGVADLRSVWYFAMYVMYLLDERMGLGFFGRMAHRANAFLRRFL